MIMVAIIRLFLLAILSITLVSCGSVAQDAQRNATSTIPLPTFAPNLNLPVKITVTPSLTLKVPAITSSPTKLINPVCIKSSSTAPSNGWDCINESYGFVVRFPSTAEIARTINNVVEVAIENSPTNSLISRLISISLGETAESCFSSDAKKLQIGKHDFMVNNGFEPSGVVYAWKSYVTTKKTKSVCFFFSVGYMTWDQDDPLFPTEEDQGLNDVEAILATFRWLNP